MACKEGQFDIVKLKVNIQFKTFSNNLNALHVNGRTPFNLAVYSGKQVCASAYIIRYSIVKEKVLEKMVYLSFSFSSSLVSSGL